MAKLRVASTSASPSSIVAGDFYAAEGEERTLRARDARRIARRVERNGTETATRPRARYRGKNTRSRRDRNYSPESFASASTARAKRRFSRVLREVKRRRVIVRDCVLRRDGEYLLNSRRTSEDFAERSSWSRFAERGRGRDTR